MKINTCLISGAGNTFHIVNESEAGSQIALWSLAEKKTFAKEVCTTNQADGLIFLKKDTTLGWNFYNNDGSDAEMCGNATRCVGYYMSEILKDPATSWALKTTAGAIKIEKIQAENYQITMTPIQILNSSLGFYCDTGVPHLIQEIGDLSDYKKNKNEAFLLRKHTEFKPRGTNVTYVQLCAETDRVKAVSFERGVEDFTEACGTGAMAAAAFNLMKRGSLQTQVEMPGGTLMMDLKNLKSPIMIGPAILLGKYEYEDTIRF